MGSWGREVLKRLDGVFDSSSKTSDENGDLFEMLKAIIEAIDAGFALTGDAVAANVLAGKTFYKDDFKTKLTGTMPNNAGNVAALSYHADGTSIHVVPAEGYTDGINDAVVITAATFLASNIKAGVTIFGVEGTYAP